MKRISSAELAQLASLPPLPVATGLTLTEQERHARELAAKALSMPSTVDGPGQPTASDGALDELCEWLRTEPALNEEVDAIHERYRNPSSAYANKELVQTAPWLEDAMRPKEEL
mgnify:CR=1 FL=1